MVGTERGGKRGRTRAALLAAGEVLRALEALTVGLVAGGFEERVFVAAFEGLAG